MGAFLNFMIFPKILGLCQELAHAQDLLETLWEVFTSNFLIVMLDLKLRIQAGTSKNRYKRRTSDGGDGNHSISLPTISIKMLPYSRISSLLVSVL